MTIELPPLPYDRTALEPHLSGETLDQHYGRHHKGHVEALNGLIAGTEFAALPLADIVRKAQGAMFHHAAQAWNNAFYWRCLKPAAAGGGGEPSAQLAEAIAQRFGDAARFRQQFVEVADRSHGSGWVWLLQRADGALAIASTANAANPLTGGDTPLLVCCLWEHAYYLDYRDARAKYIDAFWHLVDWDFAASNMT